MTLTALGVGQIINWGILYYTLTLFGPKIVIETGWSDGFVYSGFAVATLVMGLFGPLSGQAIDRIGGAPVMLIGTLIGSTSMAGLAVSWNESSYLVAWALIGVGMSSCLYDSAFASIARFAGGATRKSISLITLMAGFASTISWPATSFLLVYLNWREVAGLDALLMAFIAGPLHYFGLNYAPNVDGNHPIASKKIEREEVIGERPLLESNDFAAAMILFSIVLTALGFVANALTVHVLTLFQSLGIDTVSALIAGSLIGPAQVGARILELAFGRRLSALGLGLVPVILMPLAFVILLLWSGSASIAIVFGLVYGAANGLATIARGVVPFALFGAEGYGRRLGLLSAPALFIKAAAPALFAAILTTYGSNSAILFSCGVSLTATAAMFALFILARQQK